MHYQLSIRRRMALVAGLLGVTVAILVPLRADARWAKRNSTDFSWVDEQVRACPKGFVYGRAIGATDPGVGGTGSAPVVGVIAVAQPGSPAEGTEVLRSNVGVVRNPITVEIDPGVFQTRWLSGASYLPWKVAGNPVTLPEGTAVQITSAADFQFVTVGDCTLGELPVVSVHGATMTEGDAGARNLVFNVSLSRRPALPVTVQWQTVDGTARVANSDYQARSGTLSLAPGVREATIAIPITPDTRVENNERFTIALSAPTNSSLAPNTPAGIIRNDDAPSATSVLRIADIECASGFMATRHCQIAVTLSKPRNATTTVQFRTVDGTAKTEAPGFDYYAATGTLTFAAGSVQRFVNLAVTSNYTEVEPNEQFFVDLFNASGATINDARGVIKLSGL